MLEYHFVYKNFVAFYYSYADINYQQVSDSVLLPLVIQATLPVLFFKGVKNISSFFSFFIYVLVYIPFVDSLYTCGLPSSTSLVYGVVFFACMSMFFLTDNVFLAKKLVSDKHAVISFRTFELIVAILLFASLFVNRGNMTFVNFLDDASDLYERRAAYSSRLDMRVFYYIVLWLSHFLLPLLSVIYIKEKKYIKLILVIAASVLVYMINMQKATFIMPLVIVVAYILYKMRERFFVKYVPILFLLALASVSILLFSYSDNPSVFSIAAVFIMRSQCIEGMELDRYMHFFEMSNHPYTHYTHIGLINKLTGLYPYSESIGRVVAGDGGNSNGTFWLMDGVAADGFLGVIIISLVFILIKGLLNSIGQKYDYMVVIFSLLYVFTSCANVSLFTSLISGGLLIALLTFYFVDIKCLMSR